MKFQSVYLFISLLCTLQVYAKKVSTMDASLSPVEKSAKKRSKKIKQTKTIIPTKKVAATEKFFRGLAKAAEKGTESVLSSGNLNDVFP